MSGFGYDVLGFGSGAGVAGPEVDEDFNRVTFLSHFEGANNGDNKTFVDGSPNNRTITDHVSPAQGTFSPFARPEGYWGVEFDGNDYLSLPASADYEFGTGDLTVEYWAFPTASGAVQNILDNRAEATGWKLGRDASGKFQVYNEATTSYLFEGGTFTQGEWSHFCWTRASGVNKFFINGVQSGSNVSDSSNFDSNSLRIGIRFDAGSQPFTGSLASVRVIKGTAVEPSGLPTSPPTAVTNTKLLICQSNRFVDNSTSAHTITRTGNPRVVFGPFLTDAAYDPAVNGASVFFVGADDYVSTPSLGTLAASSNWCMECYFYCNGASQSTAYRIMSVNEAADAANYTMFRIRAGQYEFYSGGGSDAADSGLISTANFNEWTHIALTKSGTTVRGFVNGIKLWEATHNATSVISSLVIGWGYGAEYFPGYISDARLVNGSSIYTANFTPPTAPLTAITNTTLLLNMADGQAIDSTATTGTGIIGGNAKLSTGQSKFGGTSMLFDGTGDYIVVDERNLSSPLFILNTAFTIECWAYLTTWTDRVYDYNAQSMFSKGQVYINLGIDTNQKLLAYHYDGTLRGIRSSATFPLNSWRHVAWCVTGNAQKLFLDGTEVASGTWYGAAGMYSNGLPQTGAIGGDTEGTVSGWIGNIDEFRISTTARYTSNFTAPTKPFPDQGQV